MPYYVCESHDHAVEHGGRASEGVLGEPLSPQIKEKIYLHVLPLTEAEVGRLRPRRDEDGNVQHARLALPNDDVFWVATEGELAYPRVLRPRLTSRCVEGARGPAPVALTEEDLARLRAAGTKGLP